MKEKRWSRGHISKFWDNSFKDFNYIRQPITKEESDTWIAMGYDYVKSFTGSMYDNRNPMPEWIERFRELLRNNNTMMPYKNMTFTFYRMDTLEIMPVHSDHYRTYIKLHNSKPENVRRILVMLEGWKPGHYLEIDGVGITSWIAGDYFMWESNVPHAASNIGVDPRYTLQITCEEITSEDIWQSLHWFNIPGLKPKTESIDPAIVKILTSVYNNDDKPMFLYMFNERIKELETLIHPKDVVDQLNATGVDIYLYEPLCSYLENAEQLWKPHGTKHNRLFYSEFSGYDLDSKMRADELDSVLIYIQNNNLTNVKVHTCDYDVKKFYPYYEPYMDLMTDDLFVKNTDWFIPADETPTWNFTKKFICPNWRYTPHRHFITAYLAPLESHISWYYRADLTTMGTHNWTDVFKWDSNGKYFQNFHTGLEYLNRNAPCNLDLKLEEPVNIQHPYFLQAFPSGIIQTQEKTTEKTMEEYYKDAFVAVVNESRFAQPTGNYSEKVYQPMFYKRPFILSAPPKTLQFLREEGFKTFSDFWDESYDDCYIHQERLFKIFDLIDQISKKTFEELQDMYQAMIPILEHNRVLVETKLMPIGKDLYGKVDANRRV